MSKLVRIFSVVMVLCVMFSLVTITAMAEAASTDTLAEAPREESVYQIDAPDKDVAADDSVAATESIQEQETARNTESEKHKDPNTPIYVGASIAIALLIGVFIICKVKGHR